MLLAVTSALRHPSSIRPDTKYVAIVVRAEHALAVSHRARAARAWARNELACAAAELRAAARHAEQAVAWLGEEPDARLGAHAARTLSGEELCHGLAALADALAEIGRRLGGAPN
jgi:hypothetical protein